MHVAQQPSVGAAAFGTGAAGGAAGAGPSAAVLVTGFVGLELFGGESEDLAFDSEVLGDSTVVAESKVGLELRDFESEDVLEGESDTSTASSEEIWL